MVGRTITDHSLSEAPGGDNNWRHQPCTVVPFPDHVQRHAQIVKELKRRDEYDTIQDRETTTRSLQSGEPNDVVDVELCRKKTRLFYVLSFVHQNHLSDDF